MPGATWPEERVLGLACSAYKWTGDTSQVGALVAAAHPQSADILEVRDARSFRALVEVAHRCASVVVNVCPGLRLATPGGHGRGFLTRALVLGGLARVALLGHDVVVSGTWALGRRCKQSGRHARTRLKRWGVVQETGRRAPWHLARSTPRGSPWTGASSPDCAIIFPLGRWPSDPFPP